MNISSSQKTVNAVFFDLKNINTNAISLCSIDTFCLFPSEYHIYGELNSYTKKIEILTFISKRLKLPVSELKIFEISEYHFNNKLYFYNANIFILGDSPQNIGTFANAIQFKALHKKNYLYLHDGMYNNLIYSWLDTKGGVWDRFIGRYYSAEEISSNQKTPHYIASLRPLLALTGIKQVFVNAENCLSLLKKEFPRSNILIHQAFLPIPDIQKSRKIPLSDNKFFIIAHFGIPNPLKQIEKLIDSLQYLQNLEKPVRLLLAGFGVEKFIEKIPEASKKFILIEESPHSTKMHSLMNSVDLVVQLRFPLIGQASGVITELLSLGIKCICTQGFVNHGLEKFVIPVKPTISSAQLARVLTKYLLNPTKTRFSKKECDSLLQTYSFEKSSKLIMEKTLANKSFRKKFGFLQAYYGLKQKIFSFRFNWRRS